MKQMLKSGFDANCPLCRAPFGSNKRARDDESADNPRSRRRVGPEANGDRPAGEVEVIDLVADDDSSGSAINDEPKPPTSTSKAASPGRIFCQFGANQCRLEICRRIILLTQQRQRCVLQTNSRPGRYERGAELYIRIPFFVQHQ